jgi:hypothetical protein
MAGCVRSRSPEQANRGFYNGTIFHRIIKARSPACPTPRFLEHVCSAQVMPVEEGESTRPAWKRPRGAVCSRRQNFMIQGGDPTGTGRGGASIYG